MSIDRDQDADAAAPAAAWSVEGLDLAGLVGAEVVDVARECFRERNRATARLLTALHEAGRAVDGQRGRRALLDEFSGDEAAAALGWSRAMAARWLDLADDLQGRLVEVHAGMRGGDLDDTKARVFSDWTRDLADDHAHHVCEVVLPEAPALTVGALIERIQQVAAALDPQWAARRETAAQKRMRVVGSRNPSGTANLAGYDLPLERAAVGMSRVEALAAALRRRGVPVRIETLRAHVYLCSLDGTAAGLDDDALLDLLTQELSPRPDDSPDDSPDDGPDDGPDGPGPDDGPDGPRPHPPHDSAGGEGPPEGDRPPGGDGQAGGDGSAGGDDSPGSEGSSETPDLAGSDGSSEHGAPVADAHDHADADPTDPTEDTEDTEDTEEPPTDEESVRESPRAVRVRTGTVEVRLQLSTALGLDELPAQVPGWGTVLAGTARSLLERYRHGEWRVVLTDDTGRLQHVLLARRRPEHPARPACPRRPARQGRHGPAIVELQVPTTLLAALDPHDHPTWAALLTELGHRRNELADRAPGPPDQHVDPADARHRRPWAEVDRWVRVRDRRCVAPSCRRPAHATDLDHTIDHARGGPTLSWDLGCWCRHHHRAKHHGGWRVAQPTAGHFLITTRAGAGYHTRPPRIIDPLPAPRPAPTPRPLPDRDHHEHDHDDHRDPQDAASDDTLGSRLAHERPGQAQDLARDGRGTHRHVRTHANDRTGRTGGQLAGLRGTRSTRGPEGPRGTGQNPTGGSAGGSDPDPPPF